MENTASSSSGSSGSKSNAQVIGETVVKVAAVGAAAAVGKMAIDTIEDNHEVVEGIVEGIFDFLFD